VFGEEVAKIIEDSELDVGLTRETEQLIHHVHSLDNLPGFEGAILGKAEVKAWEDPISVRHPEFR